MLSFSNISFLFSTFYSRFCFSHLLVVCILIGVCVFLKLEFMRELRDAQVPILRKAYTNRRLKYIKDGCEKKSKSYETNATTTTKNTFCRITLLLFCAYYSKYNKPYGTGEINNDISLKD